MIWRRLLLLLTTAFVLCCATIPDAVARPGGGHTSSGGGGGGYGGGGGGDLGGVGDVLLGVWILFIVSFFFYKLFTRLLLPDQQTVLQRQDAILFEANPVVDGEARLAELTAHDPDFSRLAFLDFVYALWQEARIRSPDRRLEALRPYFSENAMRGLRDAPAVVPGAVVDEVVVRDLQLRELILLPEFVSGQSTEAQSWTILLKVRLEESHRVTRPGTAPVRLFSRVELEFSRAAGVRSRPPERLFVIACQACGAGLPDELGERCPHCGQEYRSPLFNWHCTGVRQECSEVFDFGGRIETEAVVEPGFRSPTRVSGDLARELALAERGDPELRSRLQARAVEVFHGVFDRWSANDLDGLRPLVTERLLGTYQFWIDGYREAGLRNQLRDWRIHAMELVRITTDPYFEAATVRLKAGCLDSTVRVSDGALISGSDRYPRYFSEYWTFSRPRSRPGEGAATACPRCAAPVEDPRAAFCGHCGSRIVLTSAQWVLAQIEQADAYSGGTVSRSDRPEPWRMLWPPAPLPLVPLPPAPPPPPVA